MKAKAKKTEIKLNDIQSAIVRKYSALNAKTADAWNALSAYAQDFMNSAVLFDGEWSESAIEELNQSLKTIQSKMERKSAGYATFASAKSVILKALRAGIANIQIPKSELEAQAKAALKAKDGDKDDSGDTDTDCKDDGKAAKQSPEALIEAALKALIEAGEDSPVKAAQGLLIKAAAKLNAAKK